jgi:hypothetical protein
MKNSHSQMGTQHRSQKPYMNDKGAKGTDLGSARSNEGLMKQRMAIKAPLGSKCKHG